MTAVLLAGLLLVTLEILLQQVVDRQRMKFQWLITRRRDLPPRIAAAGLKKFMLNGFDPEIGWVRRPNTSHREDGKSGPTEWHTNEIGARRNPGFDGRPVRISCYGDSFTFCRQVNDHETWEHYLSCITSTNVINWGIGNHGIDQSFLRLKREFGRHPSEIVLVGVVPDTISRILSTWKHFYEYGNTLGFKPRFELKHNGLDLIPNSALCEGDYKDLEALIEKAKRNDFFFTRKFSKELIRFPYVWTVLRNPLRNIPLIAWIAMSKASEESDRYYARAKQKIMATNLDWRVRLYRDRYATELLRRIVFQMAEYADEAGFKIMLVLLPQKDDVVRIRESGHFYTHFLESLGSRIEVLDLAEDLRRLGGIEDFYSEATDYGGHYCRLGNQWIAERIASELQRRQWLQ